jgi:hypothetical protein
MDRQGPFAFQARAPSIHETYRHFVMAGPDPAIRFSRRYLDGRLEAGHDGKEYLQPIHATCKSSGCTRSITASSA